MALSESRLKSAIISALEADSNFSNTLSANAPATVSFINIIVDEVLKEIKDNAKVQVEIDTPMNSIFTSGVPVPTDGGLALQTAWKLITVAPSIHKASGEVSNGSGGIT